MPVDFYELLGVERDAETGEIKQAFRQKAREYHPDVNDDERATAQFTVVRKAYEVLTDDAERADYDRMGHRTYVDKRLDGLNKFRFPGQAGTGSSSGSSTSSSSSTSTRSSSSPSSSTSSSTSSRSSWSSSRSSGSSSSSGSSRSSRSTSSSGRTSTTSSGSSNRTSSGTSSRRSSRSSRSSQTGSSRGSSTGSSSRSRRTASRTGGAGSTGRFEKERRQSETTTAEPSAPKALWYGWSVTLVALVGYLASLGRYLTGDGAALVSALAAIDTAAPLPALLATSPLSLPSIATLQTAVSSSPTTLLLPATAVLLALSLVVVVARFGHSWTTWLYALAAIVPVAILAAGAVGVARPLVVDVAGLVVLPLLGAGGFIVDVGRYLFATR